MGPNKPAETISMKGIMINYWFQHGHSLSHFYKSTINKVNTFQQMLQLWSYEVPNLVTCTRPVHSDAVVRRTVLSLAGEKIYKNKPRHLSRGSLWVSVPQKYSRKQKSVIMHYKSPFPKTISAFTISSTNIRSICACNKNKSKMHYSRERKLFSVKYLQV